MCFSLQIILWIIISIITLFVFVLVIFKNEILAAKERDPAARSSIEVLLLYEGVHAIIVHRVAHYLWKTGCKFFARLLSQFSRFFTGIEIHPGAVIGSKLFIDHGMGVVIGETSVVGENVTLYQGVTLGGTGKETGKRHPTVGNNVVIGAGAKVLGNITVGDNSYVGANAVVIKDVPSNATVVGVPARITKQEGRKIDFDLNHIHIIDPIMQTIEELEKRVKDLEDKER